MKSLQKIAVNKFYNLGRTWGRQIIHFVAGYTNHFKTAVKDVGNLRKTREITWLAGKICKICK